MGSEAAWCGLSGVFRMTNLAMAGINSPSQLMAERIEIRQNRLAAICHPLPGATAYVNRRPVNIPAAHEGFLLLEMLTARFPQIPLARLSLLVTRNG